MKSHWIGRGRSLKQCIFYSFRSQPTPPAVGQSQLSASHSCRPVTAVGQSQLSASHSCRPVTAVGQSQRHSHVALETCCAQVHRTSVANEDERATYSATARSRIRLRRCGSTTWTMIS
jgi:hypothetical protein